MYNVISYNLLTVTTWKRFGKDTLIFLPRYVKLTLLSALALDTKF